MSKIKKIAFVGAGIIGNGLAVNAMLHGYETAIYYYKDPAIVEERIKAVMDKMVKAGAASREQADEALKLGVYTTDLKEAISGAVLVEECLPERLELKKDTYRAIQEIEPEIIIASSTSGIFPTKLQEGAIHPETILVAHPYNPSYLLPLVELCGGVETSAQSIQKAREVFEDIGKVTALCKKENTGFIVNQVSWAALFAARDAICDGVCTVEDMDNAIMYGPGLRMAVTGQILTMSLGCEGGFRKMSEKYGREPDPKDLILADGVDEQCANRTPEQGRTEEEIIEYRDRMIAEILKLQNKL